MSVPPVVIEPARLAAQLEADADVMSVLRENGDIASIVRSVDLRFRGEATKVARLSHELEKLGWRVIQIVQLDASETALDVQRDQTTDEMAIHEMTETALKIEVAWGVEFDGWGTVAQRGRVA